ncbi:MAG: VTT domain-containing protein [Pseudomonadota bacterium]
MSETAQEQQQEHDHDNDWISRLPRHRTGLAALSFAESTVVPVPLETVVAPLMVGHPARAFTIAVAIWIGCLIGAALFFAVGYWAADPIVRPALQALGLAEQFETITADLGAGGLFWSVFLVSFSPAPMQLATLGAGAAQGSFLSFIAAIALSRGLRYFGLAILAQFVGERIAHLDIPKRYLIPGMMVLLAAVWGVMQLF